MKKAFYNGIEPISGKYNELEVKVRYEKGGWNYFNGKTEKRGIYVTIKPVHREFGCIAFQFTGNMKESGFKVLVKELGRKSEKWEEKVAEKLAGMALELTRLYEKEEFNTLVGKLNEMALELK